MDIRTSTAAALGRRLTRVRRSRSRLRHRVPPGAAHFYARGRSKMTEFRRFYLPVRHRSRFTTVYHCAVHKTGSQWMMSMLADASTFTYSGFSHYHYQSRRAPETRPTAERVFPQGFPDGAIVSPLYVTYENFAAMPKPAAYRAFFVMRDPRDLIVSWYYSSRFTHVVPKEAATLLRARQDLAGLSEGDGLRYAIDYWERLGRFEALRSWAVNAPGDLNAKLVRYEDLTQSPTETMADLFEFLDIAMPGDALAKMMDAYSFRKLAGRAAGDEDRASHLRKGSSGDWVNHFTPELVSHFAEVAGDLVAVMGYPSPTVG